MGNIWAGMFTGLMFIIVIIIISSILLKCIELIILYSCKIYTIISRERQTAVLPEIVIKPIKKLNYIVIENPNSIDGKKYSIGVEIKN